MTDDPGRAGALYKRADRLGCLIEPVASYHLWRAWLADGSANGDRERLEVNQSIQHPPNASTAAGLVSIHRVASLPG